MRRRFWAVVLAIGAVTGFAFGFHSLRYHHAGPWGYGGDCCGLSRREAFEDHVADVCTRAAERSYREHAGVPHAPENPK